MILPHEIAKLEESRLALALSELADEHLDVGGGVACYGGSRESWMNLVVGVAMDAPVTGDALDSVVAFYDERGVDPRIEVCPFADPSLARGLSARGFGLATFETILYRDLSNAVPPTLDPDVTLERFDASDAERVEEFVSAHLACFAPKPGPRRDAMAVGARRMVAHPRTTSWLIRVGGALAGAGSLEVLPPISTLMAGAVLEPHRGRGLQRALIEHRSLVARDMGCTVATIGSEPSSATGRNALRAGFVTAYTKAVLERGRAGSSG